MRIQISVEHHTKLAAEARAHQMGYPSLASLLKVLTINLSREKQTLDMPITPRTSPPPAILEPVVIKQPTIPNPEQFTVWPPYLSKSIWQTDPELYLFYIETGHIR